MVSAGRVCQLVYYYDSVMAEYFKYIRQLITLSRESFEEELRRLVGFNSTSSYVWYAFLMLIHRCMFEPYHIYFSGYYSGATTKESGYYCCYSRACKSEGQIVEDCEIFSTVKQQLSTHIRQAHLGLAIVCFVWGKRWWSASSWISHMKKVHTDLSSDEYYVSESTDTAKLKIKHEVVVEDVV